MVMAPAPTRTQQYHLASMVPGFPPPAFPTTISSLTSPDPSLRSQQQPSPWDCSTIPKLQLPAAAPSRGPASLSRVCMPVARTVWFPFHLGCHSSAVWLSALNVSPLTQTIAPMWGLTPASVPPPAKGRSSPTNTPVFPLVPLSYRVLRGSTYSFRWSGPPACLSWCFARTSVSEGVFLMHPWRDMYSTSPTPPPSCSLLWVYLW